MLSRHSKRIYAGCDEAGRGCLAGPVFAAAVILDSKYEIEGLNDSKKLSLTHRKLLRQEIESFAIDWAVASVSPKKIDQINILNASILAMHLAISKLSCPPEYLIIDGNRFKPFKDIPHECIIKGDAKFFSIAAASILAKTHRDEYMGKIAKKHPFYSWEKNKGYPTQEHRNAIALHGPSKYHRMSFRLLPKAKQQSLF